MFFFRVSYRWTYGSTSLLDCSSFFTESAYPRASPFNILNLSAAAFFSLKLFISSSTSAFCSISVNQSMNVFIDLPTSCSCACLIIKSCLMRCRSVTRVSNSCSNAAVSSLILAAPSACVLIATLSFSSRTYLTLF
uniref:Uncharacterized protein n=1 Tax=Cacopsylla melanoneura TaxID=428564 RepID=A0A8D8U2L3_9HEMI